MTDWKATLRQVQKEMRRIEMDEREHVDALLAKARLCTSRRSGVWGSELASEYLRRSNFYDPMRTTTARRDMLALTEGEG